jgi:hypothetical protein
MEWCLLHHFTAVQGKVAWRRRAVSAPAKGADFCHENQEYQAFGP